MFIIKKKNVSLARIPGLILPVRNVALLLNNWCVLKGWLEEQHTRAVLVACPGLLWDSLWDV